MSVNAVIQSKTPLIVTTVKYATTQYIKTQYGFSLYFFLASKLSECDLFGVCRDSYVIYLYGNINICTTELEFDVPLGRYLSSSVKQSPFLRCIP